MQTLTDLQFIEKTKLTTSLANYLTNNFIDDLYKPENIQPILDNRYNYIQSRQKTRFNSRGSIVANEILSLQFQPNGNWLAYSRMDGSLNLWHLKENNTHGHGNTNSNTRSLFNLDPLEDQLQLPDALGKDSLITCISWDPTIRDNNKNTQKNNNMNLVTSMNTNQLVIWNLKIDNRKQKTCQILQKISLNDRRIKLNKCFYSNNGSWIYGITKMDGIFIFDSKIDTTNINNNNVTSNLLYHWDLKAHSLLDENDMIYSFEIDKLDKLVFVGLKSGKIIVGQIVQSVEPNGKDIKINPLFTLNNHSNSVTALKFDPLNRYLFSGSTDGTIIYWNILQGFQIDQTITDINDSISMLDVDHLGKILSVSTENGKLFFYNTNDSTLFTSKQLTNPSLLPIFKFLPNKSWFITNVKNDILNLYTMECADILKYWKSQYETKLRQSRMNHKNQTGHKNSRRLSRPTSTANVTPLKRTNTAFLGNSTTSNIPNTNRYLNKSSTMGSNTSNIPSSAKRGNAMGRSSYMVSKKRSYDRNRYDRDFSKPSSYNNNGGGGNYGSSRFNR